jgi:hypothetical protein
VSASALAGRTVDAHQRGPWPRISTIHNPTAAWSGCADDMPSSAVDATLM